MKKLIFLLAALTVAASGYGVYSYFMRFNRAKNINAIRPELVVYASSSFIGPYGPGPYLEAEFEKICICDVVLVDSGGSELLFKKLQLPNAVVDVVVGLDQLSLKKAAASVKWRGLKVSNRNWIPLFKDNYYKFFLPYDWAPMTFIFRKSSDLSRKKNLIDFVNGLPKKSIVLQDPDLSTPGLQFVYWTELLDFDISKLKPKLKLLASDWSSAYGLFKQNQAATTYTYLTSLVYHWDIEKDFSFDVANFEDGHLAQIEYAAVPDICRSCALAERFVEFMTEDKPQVEIMNKNFMLPMVEGLTKGTSFEKLPDLKILPNTNLDQFVDNQVTKVRTYRNSLGLE